MDVLLLREEKISGRVLRVNCGCLFVRLGEKYRYLRDKSILEFGGKDW